MNVGDLIKHRKREWYAVVIGFRTELPVGGISEKLPPDNRNYPIFVWVNCNLSADHEACGEVDSCFISHMEVVQSPNKEPLDRLVS